jgi:N-acetylglucosamine malate deacetylase 1
MTVKKLIIAPHADDEVLGCGGVLDKDSFVYICGIDESKFPKDGTDLKLRLNSVKRVSQLYGFEFDYNKESLVNYYDMHDFIGIFENLINAKKPEIVLIPCSDYNQDHKAIHDAAWVALRPHDKNHFVKKVLLYETTHNPIWNKNPLNLNYFIKLDVGKKLKAYGMYETEVRGMRSPEVVKDVAKVRGKAVNMEYAEAFEILRWVD